MSENEPGYSLTPILGFQFAYEHDLIGNRLRTWRGGNEFGVELSETAYSTPNSQNQNEQRRVPGVIDITATANPSSIVSVNSTRAVRQNDFFRAKMVLDNSFGPRYETFTITGVTNDPQQSKDVVLTETRDIYLPPSLETFVYTDGNLTEDSRWIYTWDAENRLKSMEAKQSFPGKPRLKLEFQYDYMGRRVSKKLFQHNGSTFAQTKHTRFVYNGWNLIAELDGANANAFKKAYFWGLDLSSTLDGAGGVGGAIGYTDNTGANFFYISDGMGNVVSVLDTTGTSVAQYEYGPFGELLRSTGPKASENPIQFSSRYRDEETGLIYFGYRYYSPELGRWISRDPLGETGGANLYGFVANNPLNYYDPNGLFTAEYAQAFQRWMQSTSSGLMSRGTGAGAIAFNTFLGSASSLVEGFAEPFMFGNTWGSLSANPCAGFSDWAWGSLDEVSRGVSLASGTGSILGTATRRAAKGTPGLVHLTDQAGLAGISQSGSIVGRHGIFAVPEFVTAESTAMKVARTGLSPAKTANFVPIPPGAQGLFQQPVPIGPYSAWKYFGGVRYAQPGAISTATGAFTPASSLIGPKALIYGPDALFYGGAAAAGGIYLYGGGGQ